jgi:hypothetical protein
VVKQHADLKLGACCAICVGQVQVARRLRLRLRRGLRSRLVVLSWLKSHDRGEGYVEGKDCVWVSVAVKLSPALG